MTSVNPPLPSPANVPDAQSQGQYQVRLDWGVAGAARLHNAADITVWVDALVTHPQPLPLGFTIEANLNNRTAVARWILAEQVRRGDRTSIAIIGAGTDDGGFAVEDFLAAGAVIDALAAAGIDFCSPEAASAAASFVGLKSAAGHLITASVTGRELIAEGKRAVVVAAGKVDSVDSVDSVEAVKSA